MVCCVEKGVGSDKGRESVRRLLQKSRVLKSVEGGWLGGQGLETKAEDVPPRCMADWCGGGVRQ